MESIGDYAFDLCNDLSSVTIGDGVKSIGEMTFAYCFSLSDITIPESVTSIDDSAFSGSNSYLTIKCKAGSYAEDYAISHNINYTTSE